MQNLPFRIWPVAKINNLLSQLAHEDASGYFDFSGSGMVCQAGLPSTMVARHKGNSQKRLVVSVEKGGDLLWKLFKLMNGFLNNSPYLGSFAM